VLNIFSCESAGSSDGNDRFSRGLTVLKDDFKAQGSGHRAQGTEHRAQGTELRGDKTFKPLNPLTFKP